MQLPYPAPLPSWTRHGHPCLTSRPFLTIHPSQYDSLPRLFPVDLSARGVLRGTGRCFPNNVIEDKQMSVKKMEEALEMTGMGVDTANLAAELDNVAPGNPRPRVYYPLDGNPMCAIVDGKENYLLFSPTGHLKDVCFVHAAFEGESGMERFKRVPASPVDMGFSADDDGQVLQLLATDRESGSTEKGLAVARMRGGVYIGSFMRRARKLTWADRFPLKASCTVALNTVSGSEVAALDSRALSVFDVEYARPVATPCELQPLHRRSWYRWMRYGSHPRTLFLANRRSVGLVDLRCLSAADRDIGVLDPKQDWNLCTQDRGICFFDRHPRHPFQSVLATSTLLSIIDSRMLRQPLLEWNIDCSQPHLSGAIAAFDTPGKTSSECDLVIALASAPSADLWVLHAAHGCNFTSDVLTPAEGQSSPYDQTFSHPKLLWSDMPLEQLDRHPPRHELRGMALIPFHEHKRLSLVQYSVHVGTITQMLGCEPFKDGTHLFETPEEGEEFQDVPEEPEGLLQGIDSFANILNARDSIAIEKLLAQDDYQEDLETLIHDDFFPGLGIMKRLSRLDARDATHLRKRIFRDDDDGDTLLGECNIPKPYTSDLKRRRENE